MSVELLIDEAKYRQALSRYNAELDKLRGYRDDLNREINRMSGSTYSGSSVQPSIDKAKEALAAVNKAIEKAQKQRDAIEYQLTSSQSTGRTLESNMKNIEIPSLFK